MSKTYKVFLNNGVEVRTTTNFTPMGTHAYSIAFNKEADVIAETNGTLYMDYCHAEIVLSELMTLFPLEEAEILHSYIPESAGYCECDEDD